MARYTTRVRSILETYAGYKEEQDFDKIDSIIAASRGMIFTKEYDLFDEAYKPVIESKILYHYYMREIGAETAGLWKYYINRTMTEIMPYYNELYKSALLDFNPLFDVDYTREGEREGTEDSAVNAKGKTTEARTGTEGGTVTDSGATSGENSSTTNTTTSSDNKDRYSDTPQNGLSQVENNQYLTTYRNVTDSGTGTETRSGTESGTSSNTQTRNLNSSENGTINTENGTVGDIDTTEKWLERIHGKQGTASYSKMLSEFRDTILNIDEMVIKEFDKCFFGLV